MTKHPGTAVALQLIPLTDLHESPKNPRKHYDPDALKQLADTLRGDGQITPLVVRPRASGKGYEIAAGHRRVRAAKLADLSVLSAIVREMDEATFISILNLENLQRDDLNAIEEANGFATLMADAGYDVPKIAERMGRSVKYVYDRLKLLQLIPEATKLILDNVITPGHGILLARLTKADQKRALAMTSGGFRQEGGVLEPEHVDGSYFGQPGLELGDARKARSVRELQQWIDRNIRFRPDQVDRADLEFDLPETAELLDTAAATELKVLKITREYRVPDQARDTTERTYGQQGWKRADGQPEPFDRLGATKHAKPSKECDHSVIGLVAAGPGRGQAFLVCVNKDKCPVHWGAEMKARAERAKKRERQAARNGGSAAEDTPARAQADPDVIPADLLEVWEREAIESQLPVVLAGIDAAVAELNISEEICWNLIHADFQLDRWNPVGKLGYNNRSERYRESLEAVLGKQLDGVEGAGWRLDAKTGAGARLLLALYIWEARDYGDFDKRIEKIIKARWAGHRKAAAKPDAPTAAAVDATVLNQKTAKCEGCGCTWDAACEGGCSWNPEHWKQGRAVCSACVERGVDLPVAAPVAKVKRVPRADGKVRPRQGRGKRRGHV